MVKRKIHLARVYFKISNSKTTNKRWLSRLHEMFLTTDDLIELNKDKYVLSKLAKSSNKKATDVNIIINAVEFVEQYGETTNRF
jgi:hypothetical protein